MKTLIVTIAAALISLNAAAYNPGKDPDNYCVKSKNGKTIVMHNGRELTETAKLKDGTRVKPNGTIVFTSGKRVKLEKGECVDENNLGHFADRKGEMEKKVDKTEKKADRKIDKTKERAKEKKEDLKDKVNDDLD